jgi:hypothetical protein
MIKPSHDFTSAKNYAFEQLKLRGNIADLPSELQTFIRVYSAQGVIDNGGLAHFFDNDWEGQPPYRVFTDAYRAIGALEMAEWIDSVAATYDFPNPHLDRKRREQFRPSTQTQVKAPQDSLCRVSEAVWSLLEQFVAVHRLSFNLT